MSVPNVTSINETPAISDGRTNNNLSPSLSVNDIIKKIDLAHARLLSEPAQNTVADLARYMTFARNSMSKEEWHAVRDKVCLPHPITHLFHQCPFTQQAFTKPRGYPGDATLLDYLYGFREAPPDCTDLGLCVFATARSGRFAHGVRNRLGVMANAIDRAATITPKPRIFSLACGHMRELHFSVAAHNKLIGELHGLDQDELSIDTARKTFRYLPLTIHQASIKSLFSESQILEGYDLIYVSGLFDYLTDEYATLLVAQLFAKLNRGGSLLIANLGPDQWETGYVETWMKWNMIYRGASEMTALASAVESAGRMSSRVFSDAIDSVFFLEITKTH